MPTAQIFGFESDFAGSLRCIPMAVRLKLDLCGIKLTLKQWSRMGAEQRQELLALPCESAAEIDLYRIELTEWLRERGEAITVIAVDRDAWRDTHLPEVVARQVEVKGAAPLELEQWQSLSELQRFTLVKLTRPGHENENFLPALAEFGLCQRN